MHQLLLRVCYILLLVHGFVVSTVATETDETFEAELVIKGHRFDPDVLELPKGRKIRLTVYNEDDTVEEFESIDLKREKIVPSNSFIHVILAPLKPGTYAFFGDFHPDTAKGTIIVNE